MQQPHRVGWHLDAGADLPEGAGLLVDLHVVEAGSREEPRRRQPAETSPDHRDAHGGSVPPSSTRGHTARGAAPARLSTSVAENAAQSVADRYADATDADESGVDGCERRNRRTVACDVFVSISVDEDIQRECTATVQVTAGKTRRARPVVTQSGWQCEDSSLADVDDEDLGATEDEDL
jgi:hypothetical protein